MNGGDGEGEFVEDDACKAITPEETKSAMILILIAQILTGLVFLFYTMTNFDGGVTILVIFIAIALFRRSYCQLFSCGKSCSSFSLCSSFSSCCSSSSASTDEKFNE